ncbi:MAG: hypothetical protein MZU97_09045 [Bacillus subtilis]|nr:hypothetical protein [Bacillus subtilis]
MVTNIIKDTIAAISTPLGTGGVGAVRVSGKNAVDVVSKIFSRKINAKILPEFEAGRIYHGWIIDPENQSRAIDEVILLIFKAPKVLQGKM